MVGIFVVVVYSVRELNRFVLKFKKLGKKVISEKFVEEHLEKENKYF